MKKLLAIYSTTDGQTVKIMRTITKSLPTNHITEQSIEDFLTSQISLDEFDVILLGASVRYGRHKKAVQNFIAKNKNILSKKKFVFFSVCLTARKPEKCSPKTSAYTQKLYKNIPVKPDLDAVFAGKLDYPKYNFFDRNIIRFIMKITKGPTNLKTVQEFTDWNQVTSFTEAIKKI